MIGSMLKYDWVNTEVWLGQCWSMIGSMLKYDILNCCSSSVNGIMSSSVGWNKRARVAEFDSERHFFRNLFLSVKQWSTCCANRKLNHIPFASNSTPFAGNSTPFASNSTYTNRKRELPATQNDLLCDITSSRTRWRSGLNLIKWFTFCYHGLNSHSHSDFIILHH